MIEISDGNPWKEQIAGLETEIEHHQRAADQLNEQLVDTIVYAELWETETAEQEYNDAVEAADRDEQQEHDRGPLYFPHPNSNN